MSESTVTHQCRFCGKTGASSSYSTMTHVHDFGPCPERVRAVAADERLAETLARLAGVLERLEAFLPLQD